MPRSSTGTKPGDPATAASTEPTTSTRVLRRRAHGFTNHASFEARGILVTQSPCRAQQPESQKRRRLTISSQLVFQPPTSNHYGESDPPVARQRCCRARSCQRRPPQPVLGQPPSGPSSNSTGSARRYSSSRWAGSTWLAWATSSAIFTPKSSGESTLPSARSLTSAKRQRTLDQKSASKATSPSTPIW